MSLGKYPFRILVYRKPGDSRKPAVQQYNQETVAQAVQKERELVASDRTIMRTEICVTLEETSYMHRLKEWTP